MMTPKQLVHELATVMETEVIVTQGAQLPFGEIDWHQLASKVYRHLAEEMALHAMTGGDTVEIRRPVKP